MNRSFDLIAKPYRWLEYLTFGPALSRCRNHFLPALADRRRALILGDGDGRFTARLLSSNPHIEIDAVDVSPAMLDLLTRQAHAASPTASTRLQTHLTDARHFTPTGAYDLVVSHFFLDCLTQPELENLIQRFRPHLADNAVWLVSDFRVPAGRFRLPAQALVRSLYFGFRILTGLHTTRLPNHAAALTFAGLTRTAQHLSLAGLLTTELWSCTTSAHNMKCSAFRHEFFATRDNLLELSQSCATRRAESACYRFCETTKSSMTALRISSGGNSPCASTKS